MDSLDDLLDEIQGRETIKSDRTNCDEDCPSCIGPHNDIMTRFTMCPIFHPLDRNWADPLNWL